MFAAAYDALCVCLVDAVAEQCVYYHTCVVAGELLQGVGSVES